MKSLAQHLAQYKSVHFNRYNLMTHFIGIPLIIWAVMMLLTGISFPYQIMGQTVNLATLVTFMVLAYYWLLAPKLAFGLSIWFIASLISVSLVQTEQPLLLGGMVFIVGWLFQFVGHYFERAKPAFVDDLNQLLIGPLFLMAEVYFSLGLLTSLLYEITPAALKLRHELEQKRKQDN